MKIIPAQGTDQIKFGSSQEDCLKVFGKPTKEVIDDYECTNFCYFNLGLGLKFERENKDLLGWIQVTNPEAELFSLKPIGKKADDILEQLKKELGSNIEQQDLGEWQSLTFEDHWLEIQMSIGFIQQINFGVLYDDTDKPKWPPKN